MSYTKICRFCGKEFQSEARNTRYCSQDCCDKANVKNRKIKKSRAVRNKQRKENEVENRLLTRAYSLTSFVAESFNLPSCNCEFCKGDSEKYPNENHHKNLNPLDNTPNNIIRVCNHRHKIIHNQMPDINMVKVLSKSWSSENTVEELNLMFSEIWEDYLKSKDLDIEVSKYIEEVIENSKFI